MTDEIINEVEEESPEDTTPLAEDIDRSIATLAEQIDLSDEPSPVGISPKQGLAVLRPLVQTKATNDPDAVLKTLAVMHLETGALLSKHSNRDPTEIV
jgi:hypothetical protein